jgi:methionyl-tRNA synthetase
VVRPFILIYTGAVYPEGYRNSLLKSLDKKGIDEISVSRLSSKVSWGIRVPGDEDHTIYVWLDALVNYLTVAGNEKIDVHVVGKDIIK